VLEWMETREYQNKVCRAQKHADGRLSGTLRASSRRRACWVATTSCARWGQTTPSDGSRSGVYVHIASEFSGMFMSAHEMYSPSRIPHRCEPGAESIVQRPPTHTPPHLAVAHMLSSTPIYSTTCLCNIVQNAR
jgi:hypothetical protein